jgi:hypothetical protein
MSKSSSHQKVEVLKSWKSSLKTFKNKLRIFKEIDDKI